FLVSCAVEVRILEEGYRDVGFPRLLRYVLSHESPHELRVKPGTLNTSPQPTSLVFGEKPILITPPLQTHYHGGFKCISGRGRECIAVTAATYLHSHPHGNVVVLISDEKVEEIFKETIRLMKAVIPRIHHPKYYRGCESHEVMCVGVEDSWMVEAISRAIRTLIIVDGGTHSEVKSRMGLWIEMKRRCLLQHHVSDSLSPDDWKALNQKKKCGVFALGKARDGRNGMWEVYPLQNHLSPSLWIRNNHDVVDLFLAYADRLIHGREREVRILYLEKDPSETPDSWNEVIPIRDPFLVQRTTGVICEDNLFLMGGKRNPQEVLRLDLNTEKWIPLSSMKIGRQGAASVMWNHHTIMVLGGEEPSSRKLLSSCEYLDTREKSPNWFTFPHEINYPVDNHAVALCSDHIYISGGWDGTETMGKVFKCGVNGPWVPLPSLNVKRRLHGMMGDGDGGLLVIGGRSKKKIEVLETERYSLDRGERWEKQDITSMEADHAASHLGKAQGIVTVVRSIPYHSRRGVVLLPPDLLLHFGVSPSDVLRGSREKPLRDAIFEVASAAYQQLEKFHALLERSPKMARIAFLPAVHVKDYLERLRKVDFDVFHPALQRRNNLLPLVLWWKRRILKF
ncbi:unnamed protein product, partial [Darwinula stevensoni]